MTTETSEKNLLEFYKLTADIRNMEIRLFWQRSNYFLILTTAIAAGVFALESKEYIVLLSLMGLVVAILWLATNLGSKFWQSRWEYRLFVVEKRLDPTIDLFSADWETVQEDVKKSFGFRERGPIHSFYKKAVLLKPSVTFVMTLLSALFVVFWAVAFVIAVSGLSAN